MYGLCGIQLVTLHALHLASSSAHNFTTVLGIASYRSQQVTEVLGCRHGDEPNNFAVAYKSSQQLPTH